MTRAIENSLFSVILTINITIAIDLGGIKMHWSRKRSLRSVNALKLWDGNPRLEEDSDYYVSPRQIIKNLSTNNIITEDKLP